MDSNQKMKKSNCHVYVDAHLCIANAKCIAAAPCIFILDDDTGLAGIENEDLAHSLTYGANIALHFALVLRTRNTACVEEAVIVFGHFLVRTVDLRGVEVGLDHSRFEVVQNDAPWNTAEVFEHPDV